MSSFTPVKLNFTHINMIQLFTTTVVTPGGHFIMWAVLFSSTKADRALVVIIMPNVVCAMGDTVWHRSRERVTTKQVFIRCFPASTGSRNN